jgi:hypothetical protein
VLFFNYYITRICLGCQHLFLFFFKTSLSHSNQSLLDSSYNFTFSLGFLRIWFTSKCRKYLCGSMAIKKFVRLYIITHELLLCVLFLINLHFFLFVYLPKEKHTSKNVTQLRIISNSILFSFELIHSIFSLLLH